MNIPLLFLFFRFTVEIRVFRGCADSNGNCLVAFRQPVECFRSPAGREHDARVDTQVGGCCAGRTDGDTHIDAVDGARVVAGIFGTSGITAISAVEALCLAARANQNHGFTLQDVVGIAQKEFHS